jgi:hypothetical protein
VIRRLVGIALASLALAACGSVSPGTALSRWSTSSALPSAFSQLTLDARHALIALDTPNMSSAQLHTVCAVLDFETLQANASLPTPDVQTTNLLSSAYTDLGSGANECYGAGQSIVKRTRAVDYLRRADAELAEARARVAAITAKS